MAERHVADGAAAVELGGAAAGDGGLLGGGGDAAAAFAAFHVGVELHLRLSLDGAVGPRSCGTRTSRCSRRLGRSGAGRSDDLGRGRAARRAPGGSETRLVPLRKHCSSSWRSASSGRRRRQGASAAPSRASSARRCTPRRRRSNTRRTCTRGRTGVGRGTRSTCGGGDGRRKRFGVRIASQNCARIARRRTA